MSFGRVMCPNFPYCKSGAKFHEVGSQAYRNCLGDSRIDAWSGVERVPTVDVSEIKWSACLSPDVCGVERHVVSSRDYWLCFSSAKGAVDQQQNSRSRFVRDENELAYLSRERWGAGERDDGLVELDSGLGCKSMEWVPGMGPGGVVSRVFRDDWTCEYECWDGEFLGPFGEVECGYFEDGVTVQYRSWLPGSSPFGGDHMFYRRDGSVLWVGDEWDQPGSPFDS